MRTQIIKQLFYFHLASKIIRSSPRKRKYLSYIPGLAMSKTSKRALPDEWYLLISLLIIHSQDSDLTNCIWQSTVFFPYTMSYLQQCLIRIKKETLHSSPQLRHHSFKVLCCFIWTLLENTLTIKSSPKTPPE